MQLTSLSDLRKEDVIFSEPVDNEEYGYQRVRIQANYGEGKKGPLIVETPFLFSFGVSEKRGRDSEELIGYSIPLCLWSKNDEPTEEEEDFYTSLLKLFDFCYGHLEDTKCRDVAESLRDITYEKEGEPPILYAKLSYSEKYDRFFTRFRTKGNEKVKPLDYLNRYCYMKLALATESIYIGENAVSIQMKAKEVYIKPIPEQAPLLTIPEED